MIKTILLKLIKFTLFTPRPKAWIYNIAEQYIFYFRGERNGDIKTNGELRFIKSLNFKKDSVILDVGANRGDYIEVLPQEANIYAFDPLLENFKTIKERFPNIKAFDTALSDRTGSMEFYKNINFSTTSSHYKIQELADSKLEKISVKTDTIDRFCKSNNIDHIDLLKIDVEGHELSVLKGAKRMLMEKKIKNIQFEFGWASIYARIYLKDFFDYLIPLGYEIYKIHPDKLRKIEWMPDEEHCSYANFVAILKLY